METLCSPEMRERLGQRLSRRGNRPHLKQLTDIVSSPPPLDLSHGRREDGDRLRTCPSLPSSHCTDQSNHGVSEDDDDDDDGAAEEGLKVTF